MKSRSEPFVSIHVFGGESIESSPDARAVHWRITDRINITLSTTSLLELRDIVARLEAIQEGSTK